MAAPVKIYTKKGDDGTTSLWYGGRISKSDVRTDAYGSLDEAVSVVDIEDQEPMPAVLEVIADAGHRHVETPRDGVRRAVGLAAAIGPLRTGSGHCRDEQARQGPARDSR